VDFGFVSAGESAVSVRSGSSLVFDVAGVFNISGIVKPQDKYGAAIETYDANSSIVIRAGTAAFQRNSASVGGAIFLRSNTFFSLSTSQNTIFSGNYAMNGGAFATENSVTLQLPNVMAFDGNRAQFGAAISIWTEYMNLFSQASFTGNVANTSCVVFLVDSCTRLNTTGFYSNNMQIDPLGSSYCTASEYLCAPPPPPTAPEIPCVGSTPSSGAWVCIGGVWTSIGSVGSPTSLTIPNAHLVVKGNLTVTGTIVFTGLDSSITVEDGCATINGALQVQLNEQDLERISKETGASRTLVLLSQSSNCSSLSSLSFSMTKVGKSCRKVSFSTIHDSSDGSKTTLVAVFNVNSSGCNVKWIILGCVLGGVLLLALVLALVFTLNKKRKPSCGPSGREVKLTRRNPVHSRLAVAITNKDTRFRSQVLPS
jgi:hypothetical protein